MADRPFFARVDWHDARVCAPRSPAGDEPPEICKACSEAMNTEGFCTNKQCSRHGRTNRYDPAGDEPLHEYVPPAASPAGSEAPTISTEINALPERLRHYIHNLETNADPAGTLVENFALRENVVGLSARLSSLTAERDAMLRELAAMFPGSKWADNLSAITPEEPR